MKTFWVTRYTRLEATYTECALWSHIFYLYNNMLNYWLLTAVEVPRQQLAENRNSVEGEDKAERSQECFPLSHPSIDSFFPESEQTESTWCLVWPATSLAFSVLIVSYVWAACTYFMFSYFMSWKLLPNSQRAVLFLHTTHLHSENPLRNHVSLVFLLFTWQKMRFSPLHRQGFTRFTRFRKNSQGFWWYSE
jgi:hypothetical protein